MLRRLAASGARGLAVHYTVHRKNFAELGSLPDLLARLNRELLIPPQAGAGPAPFTIGVTSTARTPTAAPFPVRSSSWSSTVKSWRLPGRGPSRPSDRKREDRYASGQYAREFDRLRRLQGEDQSIMSHIREFCGLGGARVVELGAGTGVPTQKLAAEAKYVTAFDRSLPMVTFARHNLRRLGVENCSFELAEHSRIPLPDGFADVVLAAWALDSVVFDSGPDSWRSRLDRVVFEMRRLTKSGGRTIILAAPLRGERDYLGHLESAHGFQRHLFRSTWRFSSKGIAGDVIRFFLREEVWTGYEPHWPKRFAMPAGIWWKVGSRKEGGEARGFSLNLVAGCAP